MVVDKTDGLPGEAIVRDYLNSIGWEKEPPVPKLPEKVVHETTAKYRE
jgi:phosphoribosylaminoimidazole-succinocarboxamide synthase